jgi:DNA-binding MarR family transcriptional regulator
MSGFGNLFLVLTLPELRRQRLTYLSLYALQRAVKVGSKQSQGYYSHSGLRSETGLKDYETSRACKLLVKRGLIEVSPAEGDGRERILIPTDRGREVLTQIMERAGKRLWDGIDDVGRTRRVREAIEHLRKAHRMLRGPIQLTFFEKELQRGWRKKAIWQMSG